MTTIFAIVAGLALTVAIVTSLSQYGANDVRKVCVRHHGVAQLTDTTWAAGHGRATIVCRDGWVGQI